MNHINNEWTLNVIIYYKHYDKIFSSQLIQYLFTFHSECGMPIAYRDRLHISNYRWCYTTDYIKLDGVLPIHKPCNSQKCKQIKSYPQISIVTRHIRVKQFWWEIIDYKLSITDIISTRVNFQTIVILLDTKRIR